MSFLSSDFNLDNLDTFQIISFSYQHLGLKIDDFFDDLINYNLYSIFNKYNIEGTSDTKISRNSISFKHTKIDNDLFLEVHYLIDDNDIVVSKKTTFTPDDILENDIIINLKPI